MVTESTLTRKALVATDNYGPVTIPATIAAGANLTKGTILGRLTDTSAGEFKAAVSTNNDGSQAAICVLMEDAPAAEAEVAAVVGFAGVYIEANMTGLTAAYKLALEARGLYFV